MAVIESRAPVIALPSQPPDVPWPTAEWPGGEPAAGVDAERLHRLLDRAFGASAAPELADSRACVIVHRGRLVTERYANDTTADTPLVSWSVAKSFVHAMVGILVGDGRLHLDAAAPVPEWSDPADPRRVITLDQLLGMVDGLEFNEVYDIPDDPAADVPVSHAIEMLFGSGNPDMGAYAAARPPAHPPGTVFNYSSGTTNIVARIVADVTAGSEAGRAEAGRAWMRERLFDPIGMASADPRFDRAGTFTGSSFLYATARDYARFGMLYLRDGWWETRRLLPAGWVDHARTRQAIDDESGAGYGRHWWIDDDRLGTFRASGYQGQRIMVVPALDLVVVRLGVSPADDQDPVAAWVSDVIDCFDPAR
ncbi:MAG: serine hydrolase domain-containing protein [Acidimicrobiales bacterium]